MVRKSWPFVSQMVKYSSRACSSVVEQLPLKEMAGGSNPPRLTKKEIESEVGAALAATASVPLSGTKAKFKFAESHRFTKKKLDLSRVACVAQITKLWCHALYV